MQALVFPEKDRTHEVTAFHEHALWTGITDSDRPTWLQARAKLVTASGMAALLGLHPKLDALGLYAQMIMGEPANDIQYGLDSPVFWGKRLEEAISMAAAEQLGMTCKMSGALLVSRRYPNIGCTLDAEVTKEGRTYVWENKTTSAWRLRDWDEETGMAPDHILIQAQSQLIVTCSDPCIVGCLVGGQKFLKVEVPANLELQGMMVEKVDEFMLRVSSVSPPPPTLNSTDALKALYPEDDGSIINLPGECVDWLAEYQEIGQEIKRLTERKRELYNCLAAAMGEATFGMLPVEVGGKSVIKYALEHRDGYVVEPQAFRALRQLKKLGKGK